MKKAMAIEKMMISALIIVLIIVFVFFLAKTKNRALSIIEDSDCKVSIYTHSMLLSSTGEAVITDIYCPTKYYTIPDVADAQVKNYLAESLRSCWGTWGRGELNLFKDEGYFCHICSVVDFKAKDRKITGFADYLAGTKIPKQPLDGLEITYLDYLASYSSEKVSPDFAEDYRNFQSAIVIDTSKPYAVAFLYAKGDDFIKDLLEGIGSITGSSTVQAGGAVVGGATGILIGIGIAKAAAAIGISVGTGGLAVVGAAIGAVVGGILAWTKNNDVHWFALTAMFEYDADNMKELGCKIAPVVQAKPNAVT